MPRLNAEQLKGWADFVWRAYLSTSEINSLGRLRALAVQRGEPWVPSLPTLRILDISDYLSGAALTWFEQLQAEVGTRDRKPAWLRALLDVHYYTLLVAQGEGPIKFVVYHGDLYAIKLAGAVSTGLDLRHVEYSERARVINSEWWQNISDLGYPNWEEGPGGVPVCNGRCLVLTYALNEAGQVDLLSVEGARQAMDVALGEPFPWLPVRDPVVSVGDSYEVALAKYLGLEVADVRDEYTL